MPQQFHSQDLFMRRPTCPPILLKTPLDDLLSNKNMLRRHHSYSIYLHYSCRLIFLLSIDLGYIKGGGPLPSPNVGRIQSQVPCTKAELSDIMLEFLFESKPYNPHYRSNFTQQITPSILFIIFQENKIVFISFKLSVLIYKMIGYKSIL